MTNPQPLIASLFLHAAQNPGKTALVYEECSISYGELKSRVLAAAAYMRALRVLPGDRVLLNAASTPSFIYGYFASHLIHAIAVPVDPLTTEAHLQYIIDQVDPKVIFTQRHFDYRSYTVEPISSLCIIGEVSKEHDFPSLDSVADILFTTGTTGQPKGVVLSQRNILSAANHINTFVGNTSNDYEVLPLPLSHSFGLGRLRCNLLSGSTLSIINGFLMPGKIFEALEKGKATGLASVPSGLAVLLRFAEAKLKSFSDQLKYIEIGSAPMPVEHKRRLMELLPKTRLCMHYGLTEASRASFIEFHSSPHKLLSIGLPSPQVELKIAPKSGCELYQLGCGEILIRGSMVMQEYWKDPMKTSSSLKDGWLYTGDLGYRDEEGYFYLEGRETDLINVGGRKISPFEVEEAIRGISYVQDCACIGVQDPLEISGEAIKALIVLKRPITNRPSHNELVGVLRGILEPYKIPTLFQWVDEIPKTSSGKIQRHLLKHQFSH